MEFLAEHTTTDAAELTLWESSQTVSQAVSSPVVSVSFQRTQVCGHSGCESDVNDVLIFKAGKRLHIGLCTQRDSEGEQLQ